MLYNRVMRKPIELRFLAKVDKSDRDGCWLWTASVNNKGYGIIGRGGKNGGMMYAHRLSFNIANPGVDIHGGAILHSCDTPRCVNPKHLSLGTVGQNNRDMYARGRANPHRGEKSHKAKLTKIQVLEIRRRYRPPVRSNIKELSQEFGVTKQSIAAIVDGKNWRHIEPEAKAQARTCQHRARLCPLLLRMVLAMPPAQREIRRGP